MNLFGDSDRFLRAAIDPAWHLLSNSPRQIESRLPHAKLTDVGCQLQKTTHIRLRVVLFGKCLQSSSSHPRKRLRVFEKRLEMRLNIGYLVLWTYMRHRVA